jgi:hypothetical protein
MQLPAPWEADAMNIKQLKETADDLFGKKSPLTSLHQEIADQFYPERADFTVTRSIGTDFAANLMTSYPLTCRRELGNQFSSMLRPTARPWFHTQRKYENDEDDTEIRTWLQWAERTQRRAMYHKDAMFKRATKEGDHDFAAFGQCAISVELNRDANGLLYRCWHLRDMVWQEDEEGKVGFVARKWKPTAQTLVRTFRDRAHQKVKDLAEKTPFETVECLHIVCGAEMYDKGTSLPRWSLWYDVQNDHLMFEVALKTKFYVIPRWQTVSGSQYSYSPATVCALPDARLLQAMTFTLLEAGEKATSPPIIATQNVVKSDVALYAGGITWIDEEYDERLGTALRPLEQDFRGFNHGVQMNQDTRTLLHRAFFLDALTLPQRAPEMTAYEVGQRVQEYIRNALPLFEPMEDEYNAALCDETFEVMLHANGFGDPRGWPKGLRGAEIDFAFESPLHDVIEQQKGQQFTESVQLVGQAISLDPSSGFVVKGEVALRDALLGVGVPAKWLNSEAQVTNLKTQQQEQNAQQTKLAAIEQASSVAKNFGQSGLLPNAPVPQQ